MDGAILKGIFAGEERGAMGENRRDLAEHRYTREIVARKVLVRCGPAVDFHAGGLQEHRQA